MKQNQKKNFIFITLLVCLVVISMMALNVLQIGKEKPVQNSPVVWSTPEPTPTPEVTPAPTPEPTPTIEPTPSPEFAATPAPLTVTAPYYETEEEVDPALLPVPTTLSYETMEKVEEELDIWGKRFTSAAPVWFAIDCGDGIEHVYVTTRWMRFEDWVKSAYNVDNWTRENGFYIDPTGTRYITGLVGNHPSIKEEMLYHTEALADLRN